MTLYQLGSMALLWMLLIVKCCLPCYCPYYFEYMLWETLRSIYVPRSMCTDPTLGADLLMELIQSRWLLGFELVGWKPVYPMSLLSLIA